VTERIRRFTFLLLLCASEAARSAPDDTPPPDLQPPDLTPPVDLPPADNATHRVTAFQLNIRLHPFTGAVEPPKVGTLAQDARVTVVGVYKPDGLPFGWACLSPNGDQWVSMQWLTPL